MRSGFVCERYFYHWHVREVYSYLGVECSDVRIEFIKRAQHEIRINHALFPFLYIFGCNSQIIDTNHLLDTFVLQNNSLLEMVMEQHFGAPFSFLQYLASARKDHISVLLVVFGSLFSEVYTGTRIASVLIFPSVLPQLFSRNEELPNSDLVMLTYQNLYINAQLL